MSPVTIAIKQARGMPNPTDPLIGTSQMSGAHNKPGTGPYVKKRASSRRQQAIVSAPMSKAPYGIFHQLGGSIPGRPPVRKWFGVSRTAERQILKNMKSTIARMLRGGR